MKNIKREFYQDNYNTLKVWEVAYLSGCYYVRQYIAGKQFGIGARMTKHRLADLDILSMKRIESLC